MKRAVETVERAWDAVLTLPREELVLRLSALLFLLHGGHEPWVRTAITIVCCVMLIGPGWRNRWLWIGLVALLFVDLGLNRFNADNHKYLIAYWALTCALAVWATQPARVLEWNGRLLIALAFTFATYWKVAGGDFLDGSFFLFQLLTDARFDTFASFATGLDLSALSENRQALSLLRSFPIEGASVTLQSADALGPLALAMCWLTIAIEGVVAAAFWWAMRGGDFDWHDWSLIAFCVATYTLAPVIGFAFVLVVMGLAQCPEHRRDSRTGYLWTFIIVHLSQADQFALAISLSE